MQVCQPCSRMLLSTTIDYMAYSVDGYFAVSLVAMEDHVTV